MSGGWTTPEDVHEQVLRHWTSGRILAARLMGEPLFPMTLRMRRPETQELSSRFAEAQGWVQRLKAGSKQTRGFGYEIEWATVSLRQLGTNDLPAKLVVPTETDALKLIRCTTESERFQEAAELTLAAFPELRSWMTRRVPRVLKHLGDWSKIVAVLKWLQTHPRPGIYLRQMDVPRVHTKFVERHRAMLSELLDLVLPPEAIDGASAGSRELDERYGFRTKPVLVRFRILDERLRISGMSDLSIPAAELARLRLAVRRVFVTENEINGLAFPATDEALVIFGLGYGLERLAEVEWLQEMPVFYWGDIDTHGFAMLNRLRHRLPHVQSFLMDRETLMAHNPLWGQEPKSARYTQTLDRLTDAERDLFDDLRQDRLGEQVRLEQERIAFGWVLEALQRHFS